MGDEGQREFDLSEDEGLILDPPAFTGLFPPALFKSLLHKARTTTHLGVQATSLETPLGPQGPSQGLFAQPTAKQEIPTPKLFLDVVQKQWTHPGSYPTPSGNDQRFYNVGPDLAEVLQLPMVDGPVATFASSSSILSGDIADSLKVEDKKAELVKCIKQQPEQSRQLLLPPF